MSHGKHRLFPLSVEIGQPLTYFMSPGNSQKPLGCTTEATGKDCFLPSFLGAGVGGAQLKLSLRRQALPSWEDFPASS